MTPIERIVICGGGLAAHMTAAALARQLPPTMQITWVNGRDSRDADLFFGGVAPPSAYAFNLSAACPGAAPDGGHRYHLFLGHAVRGLGRAIAVPGCNVFTCRCPSWAVSFSITISGGKAMSELEPFLLPAIAARQGVFAHPVAQGPRLLARSEYGYQFNPYSYKSPFEAAARALRVKVVTADVANIECREGAISSLHLSDGQALEADLFVDCTGPDARLLSRLGVEVTPGRRLRAALSHRTVERIGAPCRTLTAREFGWQCDTPLQRSVARLTVYSPEQESEALAAHGEPAQHAGEITLGRRSVAWTGNCVAIGHAAEILEPLTQAPMLMLQRGIERLLTLIPCSRDMSVECREFNRQSGEDYTHAEIFNRALFEMPLKANSPYWRAAREEPPHEKLAQKIAQFESRGVLVAFDLEPFHNEDWTILHHGMGRRPARYDRMADRIPEAETRAMLDRAPTRYRRVREDHASPSRLHAESDPVPETKEVVSPCRGA